MEENENVRWSCNIRSRFTEDLIEYDRTHDPHTAYRLRVCYRDGVYVSRSPAKYREYMNSLRDYFESTDEESRTVCEILYGLARMRKEEKNSRKAALLLGRARSILCRVMKTDFSRENLSLMKKINGLYYRVSGDREYTVYDLYMLMKKYSQAILSRKGEEYTVTARADSKGIVCGDRTYASVDEFIRSEGPDGKPLYSEADVINVTVKK